MYAEADCLPLSGLQHFAFCPRQWALIHIEQQWQENLRTIEGSILHEKAHEGGDEKRGDLLITRGMRVFSRELGIRGVCDIVEFRRDDKQGITLATHPGKYRPIPVEYKRGSPKEHNADALQLCAQAICLEEMLACSIPLGYLFYGETRRRTEVLFDGFLREKVAEYLNEMHRYFSRGYTPKTKPTKSCKACSLADICLPALRPGQSASQYMHTALAGEDMP